MAFRCLEQCLTLNVECMKTMNLLSKINNLSVGLFAFAARMPLSVLYVLSDAVLFPLTYHVFRYRRSIVRSNLVASFPEMTLAEIKNIEKRFYHHFCDTILETYNLLGMDHQNADKRMTYKNAPYLAELCASNNGVLVVLGHYGNWEYQSFFHAAVKKTKDIACFNVYKPLKNKLFDEIMKRARSRFGNVNISKNDIYRMVIRLRKTGQTGIFGLISDQSPLASSLNFWTHFLHQETAFMMGAERMAKQTGYAVVYADVRKVDRGKYETEFLLVADCPETEPEFQITETYVRMMEQTIRRDPAFWLWTHKRWKHRKENQQINQV